MSASVSNSDRGRATPKACLSATKVCYGRCIAPEFAQHSYDSNAAGDAPVMCKVMGPSVSILIRSFFVFSCI